MKSVGQRIKELRLLKHLSQKELGAVCKLAEPTVRNYELGNRNVSENNLGQIAVALGVNISALYDRKVNSYTDVMHTLFLLANEYDISPEIQGEKIVLSIPKGSVLSDYIHAWYKERTAYTEKKITGEDMRAWENSFSEHSACKESA